MGCLPLREVGRALVAKCDLILSDRFVITSGTGTERWSWALPLISCSSLVLCKAGEGSDTFFSDHGDFDFHGTFATGSSLVNLSSLLDSGVSVLVTPLEVEGSDALFSDHGDFDFHSTFATGSSLVNLSSLFGSISFGVCGVVRCGVGFLGLLRDASRDTTGRGGRGSDDEVRRKEREGATSKGRE